MGLPDRAVAHLAGDHLRVVAVDLLRRLQDETAHVAVVVARQHDDQVAYRAVADPPLGAVEDPVVAVAAGRRLEADDVRAVRRLGQADRPEHLDAGHAGQPALALLLRAEVVDRGHREPGVDRVEGRDRPVAAGQLGAHHPLGQRGHPGAPVPVERGPRDPGGRIPGQDLGREARLVPPGGGVRRHLLGAPAADAVAQLALAVGEQLVQTVEVGAQRLRQVAAVGLLARGLGHRCRLVVHDPRVCGSAPALRSAPHARPGRARRAWPGRRGGPGRTRGRRRRSGAPGAAGPAGRRPRR